MDDTKKRIVGYVILAVLCIIPYLQTFNHEFTNYDDDHYIVNNYRIHSGLSIEGIVWAFGSTEAANWHPLTWISHMIDFSLFGYSPGMHHMMNLLLHLLNACMLLLFLELATGAFWRSFFVAVLFAIHPLHVESVAWAAERKDVLCVFFWLLTMLAYLRYVRFGKMGNYLLVCCMFFLALLSKPMAVTLPLVLLMMDYWPLRRWSLPKSWKLFGSKEEDEKDNEKDGEKDGVESERWPVLKRLRAVSFGKLFIEKVPLLILVVVSSLLTLYAQNKGGAIKDFEALPLWVRLFNSFVSYIQYLVNMVWPVGLGVFYPHPGKNLELWKVGGSLVLLVSFTLLVLRRARSSRYLFVGWLWYLVTLLPVIGIIQVGGQALADRYAYITLVGVFVILAWGMHELTFGMEKRTEFLWGAGCVVVLILTALCFIQTGYWKNTVTLFEHTLKVAGPSSTAHHNYAYGLFHSGRPDKAIPHYEIAVQMNPKDANSLNNYGNALALIGQHDDAMKQFERAKALAPEMAESYNNIGIIHAMKKEFSEAESSFLKAIEVDGNYVGAYGNLGYLYLQLKEGAKARKYLERAVSIAPYNGKVMFLFGKLLEAEGDPRGRDMLNRAMEIDPGLRSGGSGGIPK